MIPNDAIVAWRRNVSWRAASDVEQDLLLSRLIIEIANDALLGTELIFRGGTCFHKLYLPMPLRYSEDLDYVRRTNSPIGPIFDALRSIGEVLGMKVNTEVTRHPKVYLRAPFEDGSGRMRIKIEMNTHETTSALSPRALRTAIPMVHQIIRAFANYRPDEFNAARATEVLADHLANAVFRGDAAGLAVVLPFDYDVDAAAELVTDRLLSRIGS
jgi:predicted nucleotidyltransferase component of viral defense system